MDRPLTNTGLRFSRKIQNWNLPVAADLMLVLHGAGSVKLEGEDLARATRLSHRMPDLSSFAFGPKLNIL